MSFMQYFLYLKHKMGQKIGGGGQFLINYEQILKGQRQF